MPTNPQHFRPGMLFNAQTFDRVQSDVYNQTTNLIAHDDDDEDEDQDDVDNKQDLGNILYQARATQIDSLSQMIRGDRSVNTDELADYLLELIGTIPEPTTSTIVNTGNTASATSQTKTMHSHPYPPINHYMKQKVVGYFLTNNQFIKNKLFEIERKERELFCFMYFIY